jgi:hypothetical protein
LSLIPTPIEEATKEAEGPTQRATTNHQKIITFDKSLKLSSKLQKAVKKYLNINYEDLTFISQVVPEHYRLQIWRTLKELITIRQVVSYNDKGEQIPANFVQLNSGYNQTEIALNVGTIYGVYNNKNIILEIGHGTRIVYIVMYTKNDGEFCQGFACTIEKNALFPSRLPKKVRRIPRSDVEELCRGVTYGRPNNDNRYSNRYALYQ